MGPKSLMKMAQNVLQNNIAYAYDFKGTPPPINHDIIFQSQWASLNLLTNKSLGLQASVPDIESFTDLTDGNSIQAYPEFSYFKNYY